MSHDQTAATPTSDDEYLDVLVLCSAPVDLRPSLNLAQELANFEDEIRRSPLPIRLRRVFPPTLYQLQRTCWNRHFRDVVDATILCSCTD